jgi:radical SAM protein with 4Fe4S-binding SPASM domain
MKIIEAAIELDLPLQINTTMSRMTRPFIESMARRVREWPIALWAIFFLVRTGRGASLDQVTADECEDVLTYLYNLSLTAPFGIKTTEAPQFQRVIWQHEHDPLHRSLRTPGGGAARLRAPRSVNDGNGFLFIDHVGNVCPSGFLPLARGNVRIDDLASIYRDDQIFRRLRDADALMGKCGRCEFREVCGGSRGRAYAATGSLVASDPLCAYDPGPEMRSPVPVA